MNGKLQFQLRDTCIYINSMCNAAQRFTKRKIKIQENFFTYATLLFTIKYSKRCNLKFFFSSCIHNMHTAIITRQIERYIYIWYMIHTLFMLHMYELKYLCTLLFRHWMRIVFAFYKLISSMDFIWIACLAFQSTFFCCCPYHRYDDEKRFYFVHRLTRNATANRIKKLPHKYNTFSCSWHMQFFLLLSYVSLFHFESELYTNFLGICVMA